MEGYFPSIPSNSSPNTEEEEKEEQDFSELKEELPCNRFSLPAHLAVARNQIPSEFDRPQEGLAIYAAFSEAVLNFVREGKLNAQQVAYMNKLLKSTLEDELGNCVQSTTPFAGGKKIKGNRKRQRVSGDSWRLNGALVSYHKEGRKMQLTVAKASVQTQGLVFPSEHLVISSLHPN